MLYVKRLSFTVSEDAARFIRDALLDSADFVEDSVTNGEASSVITELRRIGRAVEASMLVPATPAEYDEIHGVH